MGEFVKCFKCKEKRYAGIQECDCRSGCLLVNEGDVSKEQLFNLMHRYFDGAGVLKIDFKNGINWLCTQGWKEEAIWWKFDNEGRIFTKNNIGWEEIFIKESGPERYVGEVDTLKLIKAGKYMKNSHNLNKESQDGNKF